MFREETINKLENILVKYSDLLSEFEVKDQIISTFKFEKPLTSIEIEMEDTEIVEKFIEELENYFFVGHVHFEPDSQEFGFSGLIFVSRFKNLFDVAMNYANEHNGLLDGFADSYGILCGISSKQVAEYCLKKRLKKYNLIK